MAGTDPFLGTFNLWRGDAIQSGPIPTLYHSEPQYASQICRLGLAERGCEWRSRLMDIQVKTEQLDPWFLKLNPAGSVPILVRTVDGVETVCANSLDILRFVDTHLEGPKLLPQDAAAKARVEEILTLHYAVPMEDFTQGHLLLTNPGFRHVIPKVLEGSLPLLKEMAADEKLDAVVRTAAERKARETEALLKRMEEPEAMFTPAKEQLLKVLDALEALLGAQDEESHFLVGEEYTLADVVMTVLLARAQWADDTAKAVAEHKRVAVYWDRMRARPSFVKADIWAVLRPGRVFCAIGAMAFSAASAVGGFLHDTVVHPVQQTDAYKWAAEEAAPFIVDHYNFTSVVVVEDVTLPAAKMANDNIVEPTREASMKAYEASLHAVQDTANATTGALVNPLGEAGSGALHQIGDGAKAAEEAAEKAMHAAADVADKAIGPAKDVVMEKVVPGMADHGARIAEYTDKVEDFVRDNIIAPVAQSQLMKGGQEAVAKGFEDAKYHFTYKMVPGFMDSMVLRLV